MKVGLDYSVSKFFNPGDLKGDLFLKNSKEVAIGLKVESPMLKDFLKNQLNKAQHGQTSPRLWQSRPLNPAN